ncbi:tyrosine-type recombinase/integrase [Dysgonomonas capnocytophagoides]|uniref:tyrosine-type recombinase/integrase n=1 Tax=Dysgonomonas capnocytophagoides TaxID=45254 RepID=UPI003DA73AD8
MQNAVNQNIRTLTIFLQSTTSYLFRFGNYRGNGLVTEILLYLAISCFLTKQQIRAFQLIINELRFIRCVSLLPVSAVITHVARHSFATLALSYGMSIESVSKMLGHNQIRTTQIYAKVTEEKIAKEMVAFKNRKKRA